MRILFLTSALERVAGYWRAIHLARQLVALRHEVTVVCQRNERSFQCDHKIIDGVRLYLLPPLFTSEESIFQSAMRPALMFFMQTGLNILRGVTSDIDVLHTFDALLPQNALPTILSKRRRPSHRPLVFVDWDDWWGRGGILDVFSEGVYRKITSFLTFMEEKVPLYADGVTVTNQILGKRAIGVGVKPEDLFVIPNGADVEKIKSLDMYDARKFLRLPPKAVIYATYPKKAVHVRYGKRFMERNSVLLAHKTVVAAYPNAFLLLLGRESEEWMAEAKSLGVDKRIISVGFQPADRYSLYLSASNFFIFSIKNTVFDRARSPLRIMDYMAAGRPIIATDLPEIKEVAHGCGLFFRPCEPGNLAEKILHAIREPDLCKKMGELARERAAKRYSWSALAQQLEKAYYQML